MRIVEHSVRRWESYPEADTETCLWEACVEHEGEYYEVQVEARRSAVTRCIIWGISGIPNV